MISWSVSIIIVLVFIYDALKFNDLSYSHSKKTVTTIAVCTGIIYTLLFTCLIFGGLYSNTFDYIGAKITATVIIIALYISSLYDTSNDIGLALIAKTGVFGLIMTGLYLAGFYN